MEREDVKALARELGADLCGVAAASRFGEAPEGFRPEDVLPRARSVVVTARRFLQSALGAGSSIPYTDVRNHLTRRMDDLSTELAYRLEDAGARAVPVNAIGPTERDPLSGRTRGILSLKHAAALAGLGWIGRNTLLVTPEHGNLVWLGGVVTDLELEPDPVRAAPRCPEGCRLCRDACPSGALDRDPMDQRACWEHAFGSPAHGGEWRIRCFACRSVCPFARKGPGEGFP